MPGMLRVAVQTRGRVRCSARVPLRMFDELVTAVARGAEAATRAPGVQYGLREACGVRRATGAGVRSDGS